MRGDRTPEERLVPCPVEGSVMSGELRLGGMSLREPVLDSREGRPLALEDGCNHLRKKKRLLGCLRDRERLTS